MENPLRSVIRALVLGSLLPVVFVSPSIAERSTAPASPSRGWPAYPMAATAADSTWHRRLLNGMASSNVLIENTMASGDVYQIGRDGGNYVEALILGFRATGDFTLLSRVYDLTQIARAGLRDTWLDGTADGYTDWNWLADPTNATFYGKDTDWLDESIASGNVALWAYTFNVYRNADPRYAEAADFWRGWLENQFLAKWYQRAGTPLAAWDTPYAAFYKPDTEPRSANWRLAYYLWLMTGNSFYRDRANEIQLQLKGANVINPAHPSAYRWAQQLDPTTQTWQTCNYANYYNRVIIEMRLEGLPTFPTDWDMKRFAGTYRDVVYPGAMTTMANDVNGGGSTTYALYAFNGFAPWDSTGFLANLAERSITGSGYAAGGLSKAARNDVFISGYALMGSMLAAHPAAVPDGRPSTSGALELAPARPSPFSESTSIDYSLARDGHVRVAVYDVRGRLVRLIADADVAAGPHAAQWDGRDDRGAIVADGVYVCAAETAGVRATRKLVRIR
jgi:hypothetical protein